MTGQVALDRHPMQEDLENLRVEALQGIACVVVAAAFALLASGLLDPSLVEPRIALVSGMLVGVAGASWRLLHYSYSAAAVTLLGGMLASAGVAANVYSVSQVLFALPLVVFVVPLLVGYRWTLVTVVGASALVWGLGRLSLAPLSVGDLVGLQLLLITSAGVAWIAVRPMQTMLNWAWASYLEERCKTQEVRARQAELAQVSKSLTEACERLEHANRALAQARRAAEEARRLKDEFATAISHELRTPLNLIIGFSEMIVEGSSNDDPGIPDGFRSDVEAIYRNACHLSTLIDDVLDLGRLEAQRLALQKEWSAFANIVQEAVTAVEGLYAKAGLTLEVDLPLDLPPLYVDPTRIRQVLINLLANAVRYTEEGGVRVTAHREEGDVIVVVADTGVGIPPEDLPYVFERFRQTGPLRRRGGFGLGLTVSKQFVELHAGTMWVASEPGKGSRFSFSLPVMDTVAALTANPKLGMLEGAHRGDRGKRTILVLDDEAEAGRIFQRYLDEDQVHVATTPSEAARLARGQPVHAAVVTNPGTPAVNDLIRAVVRHHPRVPVLRCTLRTISLARRELGVAAFLTKPVTRDQLRDTFRQLKLRPRRALIVDDDVEMVRLLSRMLHAIAPRCRIQTATSGDEGLALIAGEKPDVVLLDLLMPGMDGHAFLEIWNADAAARDVPVVVVSAASEEDHDLITGESVEIRRDGGLSVAELMRVVRGSLDGLLPSAADRGLDTSPGDEAPATLVRVG